MTKTVLCFFPYLVANLYISSIGLVVIIMCTYLQVALFIISQALIFVTRSHTDVLLRLLSWRFALHNLSRLSLQDFLTGVLLFLVDGLELFTRLA